jgi:hypothetical protein
MPRLPVSNLEVELVAPVGDDEILLAEATRRDVELALELARRLTRSNGDGLSWDALPLADLDAFFLFLRQSHFGDLLRGEAVCPSEGCHQRIDISFTIGDYLEHYRPRRPAEVESAEQPGWFRLRGTDATFRLPRPADLIAVRGSQDPEGDLADRCVMPEGRRGALLRRIQRAMSAMAPNLCQELDARCPECRAEIRLRFDPQDYTLRELQQEAASVHEEVDVLASIYHWHEADILALPRRRRSLYVEMAIERMRA